MGAVSRFSVDADFDQAVRAVASAVAQLYLQSRLFPWCLSVSNSLSGGDRELDEVPAVGDPAHVAEIGKGLRVSTDERRRCVSLQ